MRTKHTSSPTRTAGIALATAFLAAAASLSVATTDANAGEVRITITGYALGDGAIRVAAFESDDDFAAQHWAAKVEVEPSGERTEVVFSDLPAGEYGFVAFQDSDGNGDISKSFIGAPKEAYGFSNQARGLMGPPSFEEARVRIPSGPLALDILLD